MTVNDLPDSALSVGASIGFTRGFARIVDISCGEEVPSSLSTTNQWRAEFSGCTVRSALRTYCPGWKFDPNSIPQLSLGKVKYLPYESSGAL